MPTPGSSSHRAAGAGSRHPDWYVNLLAHPDQASIELLGREAVAVTPQRLGTADRAPARERIGPPSPASPGIRAGPTASTAVIRLT